ncbi:MAG: xanthine dehydrogenase family protein molybdopterin-binding subunit, partial [Hyphomicrobiaceae bacterium]
MNDISLENKWIGKRTIRPDGEDKVTGRAQYAADYKMAGQIYGKVLRSPHPHARIRSIDTSKALALPGVKAVVTGKDFVEFPVDKSIMLGIQDMRWMARNVIAREKALFIGHPVAAVAAATVSIAKAALKLIEVDYEVLPWAIEIDDALKPDAPILHDHIKFDGKPSNIASKLEHKLGDIEAGFKQADLIVERSFSTRPIHQGYIEPHACVVSVGQDGHTLIWSSSQGQFMVRAMCAYLNDLEQSQIRAIPAEIGGGFGGKTIVYLEPLAVELSRKSGRPVKMTMTRDEVFHASGPTSGSQSKVKIGVTKDGRIVAGQGTFYLQSGAFPGAPIRGAAGCAFAPYDIPNVVSTGYEVVSNRSKVAAYRGPGAPIGAHAVELVLDEIAS